LIAKLPVVFVLVDPPPVAVVPFTLSAPLVGATESAVTLNVVPEEAVPALFVAVTD